MTAIRDWETGTPCDRHDLAYCADCRDLAGLRRDQVTGKTVYQRDCAIQTFAEITGVGYEEAAEIMRDAGARPGSGTPKPVGPAALVACGFTVTEVTRVIRIEDAPALSASGRRFYVSASKGRRGHAWSVTDGQANRPWPAPYSYRIYEVS
jgi:hypothetical protein